VFVSQVSTRLHETDLIRKADRSLLWYIANKEIDWVSVVAQLDKDTGSVQHNENGGIDDGMQDNPILPVKVLFRWISDQKIEDIVKWLAEQSVRTKHKFIHYFSGIFMNNTRLGSEAEESLKIVRISLS